MHPIPSSRQATTPGIQLLKLGLFATIGMIAVVIVSFLVLIATQGLDFFKNPAGLANFQSDTSTLKIILVVQQILVFLLPALVFAKTEGLTPQNYYDFKRPQIVVFILVFALMFFATPILSLVTEWNAHMKLPTVFKGIENWMRKQENDAAETTELILQMKNWSGMLINLLVIAVIPAFCEELLFRGALQGIFLKLFRNPHLAIWISAIIFSAIHVQFFGFLPRMLLGAAFGYLYFWTKSLWYTIFAHFVNNGYAVIMAYYLQRNNLPVKEADEISIAWYGYVISAILTLALFQLIKNRSEGQSLKKG